MTTLQSDQELTAPPTLKDAARAVVLAAKKHTPEIIALNKALSLADDPLTIRCDQLPSALHRSGIGCIVEDGLCKAPHLTHSKILRLALDTPGQPGYAAYVPAENIDR